MTEIEFWKLFLDKNNNIAVHCNTQEKVVSFCKMMDNRGLTWRNGDRYIGLNSWIDFKKGICCDNQGQYGSLSFFYSHKEWTVIGYDYLFGTRNLQVELL